MSARPSFQFYARDWMTCPELRRCSVAARGLWADMLALAHFGEPYGHLASKGRPYDAAEIARLTGCGKAETGRLLAELERNGVCSRAEDGAIYSRRMVRDETVATRRADGGELGAEHGKKGAAHGANGGRPKSATAQQEGQKKPPFNPPLKPPFCVSGKPPSKPPPASASASASAREIQPSPSAQAVDVAPSAPPSPPPGLDAFGQPPGPASQDPGPDPQPKAPRPRKVASPSSAASRIVSDAFCAAFERTRGERYVWQGGKDGQLLSGLLAQFSGDVALIQRRIDAFLADPFWGPKADFATFCAKHNTVAGAERASSHGQRSVLEVIANAGRPQAGVA